MPVWTTPNAAVASQPSTASANSARCIRASRTANISAPQANTST
ncbi:MAG: hypothetical protein WDN72_10730 [Alphaproteobacteria bacterium]